MSRSAKVRLVFDEARDFRLGIGQLEELQERTDAGPEELFNRLRTDRWRTADIQQTLRLGLIGAGESVTRAAVLVERNASVGNLIEWKDHCRAILYAAMAGAPDEEDGDPDAGEMTGATGSPDQNSGSDVSMGSVPFSVTRRTKSGGKASGTSGKPGPGGSAPTGSKTGRKPQPKPSSKPQ